MKTNSVRSQKITPRSLRNCLKTIDAILRKKKTFECISTSFRLQNKKKKTLKHGCWRFRSRFLK